MSQSNDNAENYRKMIEPRPIAEVEANVKRFCDGMEALRRECSIGEAFYVLKVFVKNDEGQETCTHVVGMFGASTSMESLAAFGFGYAGADRQRAIRDLVEEAASVKNHRRVH
jgi:hypothetical protein